MSNLITVIHLINRQVYFKFVMVMIYTSAVIQ